MHMQRMDDYMDFENPVGVLSKGGVSDFTMSEGVHRDGRLGGLSFLTAEDTIQFRVTNALIKPFTFPTLMFTGMYNKMAVIKPGLKS